MRSVHIGEGNLLNWNRRTFGCLEVVGDVSLIHLRRMRNGTKPFSRSSFLPFDRMLPFHEAKIYPYRSLSVDRGIRNLDSRRTT